MNMIKFEKFKSGCWREEYKYKYFLPEKINHGWTWEDPKINTLLEDAIRALGELNSLTTMIPDIDLFIRMHIFKEAERSSRIEGTQTTLEEALSPKELIPPEKREGWQEINNYVSALNNALEQIKKEVPLSNRLLKDAHKTLLEGVRGENKFPGEFRKSQNWIGGSNINNASFIPPHHDHVPELMGDLELFLHNKDIEIPHLIRIAIAHYQFETIHPFLDGNGRIGRLMIPLYLISNGLLEKPSLYLSYYFESNRNAYYDALTIVRESNNLIHWIKFFLNGILETAKNSNETFRKILTLCDICESKIIKLGRRAENARILLHYLYSEPSITIGDVQKILKLEHKPATNLVKAFIEFKILCELAGKQRNKLFYFDEYLSLFEEHVKK